MSLYLEVNSKSVPTVKLISALKFLYLEIQTEHRFTTKDRDRQKDTQPD